LQLHQELFAMQEGLARLQQQQAAEETLLLAQGELSAAEAR
jgi:hypothetical protein